MLSIPKTLLSLYSVDIILPNLHVIHVNADNGKSTLCCMSFMWIQVIENKHYAACHLWEYRPWKINTLLHVLYVNTGHVKSTLYCMSFMFLQGMKNQHYYCMSFMWIQGMERKKINSILHVIYVNTGHGKSTLFCMSYMWIQGMENQHDILLSNRKTHMCISLAIPSYQPWINSFHHYSNLCFYAQANSYLKVGQTSPSRNIEVSPLINTRFIV